MCLDKLKVNANQKFMNLVIIRRIPEYVKFALVHALTGIEDVKFAQAFFNK